MAVNSLTDWSAGLLPLTANLTNLPEIVVVPGGRFLMGSEQGQENERPCHRVWVDSFGIGKYPVTNREYGEFLTGSGTAAPPFWRDPAFSDPEQPAVGVRWDEAISYCRWLSEKLGQHVSSSHGSRVGAGGPRRRATARLSVGRRTALGKIFYRHEFPATGGPTQSASTSRTTSDCST